MSNWRIYRSADEKQAIIIYADENAFRKQTYQREKEYAMHNICHIGYGGLGANTSMKTIFSFLQIDLIN